MKKLNTVGFQVYDIAEKAQLWRPWKMGGCQGLGRRGYIGRKSRVFRAVKPV